MAAVNVAAAVFVTFAFAGVGFNTPWRQAAQAFGVALLASWCIGTLCAIFIPRLSPRLWKHRFPFNWVLLIAWLFGFAMAGSAATVAILAAIGYIPAARFAGWMLGSARYAIITTLTFGLAVSAYELMRARIEAPLVRSPQIIRRRTIQRNGVGSELRRRMHKRERRLRIAIHRGQTRQVEFLTCRNIFEYRNLHRAAGGQGGGRRPNQTNNGNEK